MQLFTSPCAAEQRLVLSLLLLQAGRIFSGRHRVATFVGHDDTSSSKGVKEAYLPEIAAIVARLLGVCPAASPQLRIANAAIAAKFRQAQGRPHRAF
jgi:hypothetical protein